MEYLLILTNKMLCLLEMEYLVVSGYQEMDPFTAPLPVSAAEEGEALISPAFTESLIDWFGRWMGMENN